MTEDTFCLTKLSENLLILQDIIKKLNSTDLSIYIDLIQGDIKKYQMNGFEKIEKKTFFIEPGIKLYSLENINPVDYQEQLVDIFSELSECSEELKDFLLNSMYMEIQVKKKIWLKSKCEHIPRLENYPDISKTEKDNIFIVGRLIEYTIHYKDETKKIYFDQFSGEILSKIPYFDNKEKEKMAELKLPLKYSDSDKMRNKISDYLIGNKKENASDLKFVEMQNIEYRIPYSVERLKETI